MSGTSTFQYCHSLCVFVHLRIWCLVRFAHTHDHRAPLWLQFFCNSCCGISWRLYIWVVALPFTWCWCSRDHTLGCHTGGPRNRAARTQLSVAPQIKWAAACFQSWHLTTKLSFGACPLNNLILYFFLNSVLRNLLYQQHWLTLSYFLSIIVFSLVWRDTV